MRLSSLFLLTACGVLSCGNILGLDSVRNCEGAECQGDATTSDVIMLDSPAAETSVADADATAFSPSDFGSDLVVWLDASQNVQVVGGSVEAWTDLTPAKLVALQSSTNLQPTLHKQGLVGHDAVRFFDSTQYLEIYDNDAGQLHWGADLDFVISVVVSGLDSTNTPCSFFNKAKTVGVPPKSFGDGTLFGLGFDQLDLLDGGVPDSNAFAGRISYQSNLSAPETVWSFGASGQGIADNAAHVVTLHRAVVGGTTTLEIRVDGVSDMVKTVVTTDVTNANMPITIGGPHLAGATFNAGMLLELAELVAAARNGAFAPSEIVGLEKYLKTKYGL